MTAISVIIPNYNGRHFLEECIPSLLRAMAEDRIDHEVIVVDDASTDDSVPYLEKNYPSVKLIKRAVNGGFSRAVNEGIKLSKHGLLLLLNNDIRVSPGFIAPLLPFFDDKNTFAVTNRTINFDNAKATKAFTVEFKFGNLLQVHRKDSENASLAFGASGGHALFDRIKFIELGCFDELYSPFYWEDADICYRAYKRGYVSIYEPKSTVLHKSQGSIGRLSKFYVNYIYMRNYLIFVWKNITDSALLFQHIIFLPAFVAYHSIRYPATLVALFGAAFKIPAILRARAREKPFIKFSDRDIFNKLREE